MGDKDSDQIGTLRSIAESIGDGVIVVDARGRLILVNKAAKGMSLSEFRVGYPFAEQAILAGMRDCNGRPFTPDELPIVRALRGETLANLDIIVKRPDGSDACLNMTSSPLRDESGQITGAIGVYRDITERKTYEEKSASLLRQLERQQHLIVTIVDNVPASVIYVDLSFDVVWLNRRASDVVKLRREQAVGQNFFALYSGSEEQVGAKMREAVASGQPRTFNELPYVLPDGRCVFLDISYVPIKEGDQVLGLLITAVDVTAVFEGRQRAEDLARDWKAMVDAAHSVLQEVSLDRLAQILVEQAAEVTKANKVGLWLADPQRREFHLLAYHNLLPATVEAVRTYTYDTPSTVVRAALTGQLQETEDISKLGPEFATTIQVAAREGFRSQIAVPLWVRGRLVGMLGLARLEPWHLTDQGRETIISMAGIFASALLNARLYEESGALVSAAQQRASELEATLASIADPVFVVDASGRIKMLNRVAMGLIAGLDMPGKEETLADYLVALNVRHLNGEPLAREELGLTRALRGEVVPDLDEIISSPATGRDVYLLVSAAPILDESGKVLGAIEVIRDVTRIREMERLRDEFLTTAAHELKTPVTVLKGYAQALLKAPEALPPKFTRALEAIDRQSTRINRLVADLLDISRLMAGRMEMRLETLDLAGLVIEVVDRMALTTTRHQLNLAVDAHPIVRADRDRLEQVVINLVDNAIKYSPQGGPSQGRIEVRVYEEDGQAVVSVRDYGIGIPKERQEHIFERFYRAHVGTPFDYGGMGVGLYITREIVSRHGGQIWFDSKEGQGSTFYFSLPEA